MHLCQIDCVHICTISSLFDVLFGSGVPDGRSIFESRSDIGLVTVCIGWSWAVAGATSEKGEGAICFFVITST